MSEVATSTGGGGSAMAVDAVSGGGSAVKKKGKLVRPRGKRGGIKHHKRGQAVAVQSAAKATRKAPMADDAATSAGDDGADDAATSTGDDGADGATATAASEHADKIARFHTLLKQLEQARSSEEKDAIQQGLDALGGLAQYQAWSLTGSAKAGQTPTSKWCVEALTAVYTHDRSKPKFRVLDVGAITGSAYAKYRWIDPTYIDLHPQGANVLKSSFFDFPIPDPSKGEPLYDLVALSLVVNFVGDVRKRGDMLRHVHSYLVPEGFCFLVLPLQSLTNSRYMNQSHLRAILGSLGFDILKQSDSAKLSRWLLRRKPGTNDWDGQVWKKREINPGKDRNNFAIVIDPKPE